MSEVAPGDVIDVIDIEGIKARIPHRYPMLMIERVLDVRPADSAIGVKNVSVNEGFFQGHFPGAPVMPGILIIEAMAQTAAVLVVCTLGEHAAGKLVYFMTIDNARFRHPVYPGDRIELHVKQLHMRPTVWKIRGEATVDGKLVAEATMKAMIMLDKETV
ncbi:MAG: 3-hydroxyacyl-ACP dehydratase FabZ [Pseudomonadota bacterium]